MSRLVSCDIYFRRKLVELVVVVVVVGTSEVRRM